MIVMNGPGADADRLHEQLGNGVEHRVPEIGHDEDRVKEGLEDDEPHRVCPGQLRRERERHHAVDTEAGAQRDRDASDDAHRGGDEAAYSAVAAVYCARDVTRLLAPMTAPISSFAVPTLRVEDDGAVHRDEHDQTTADLAAVCRPSGREVQPAVPGGGGAGGRVDRHRGPVRTPCRRDQRPRRTTSERQETRLTPEVTACSQDRHERRESLSRTQRGPSKYEFEGPRQRPSTCPRANPGPERPAGVTAAAVLARQAGLRTSGWSPDRF